MDRSVYGHTVPYPVAWGNYTEQSVNTPGFQRLKQGGQPLPQHNYLFSREDGTSPLVQSAYGWFNERKTRGIDTFYGSCQRGAYSWSGGAPYGSSFDSIERVHQILSNKLAMAARDSPIDLGVSLGEYRETAGLVTSAMLKTAKLYRAVRKFDFSLALKTVTGRKNNKVSDAAKAAADAWLGFTYGVRPLMNDVYGAMDALSSDEPVIPIHVIRAGHRVKIDSSNQLSHGGGRAEGEMRGSAKYVFSVDNPLLFTLDQIGVINPLSLVWELIPFSFVVDWFIPIGSFLRGIVPPPGISSLHGYTYVKGEGSASQYTNWDWGSGPGQKWTTKADTRSSFKDRKILNGFPKYHLLVPDLSLSKEQIGSGLALLTQLLKD